MRMIMAVALTAAVVGATPALAADGCGPGRFRSGLFGHCHWDGPPPPPPGYYGPGPAPGPAYYAGPGYGPGPIVVDRWYPGRGYWDGRRYWWHRHRWSGGWRYY